MARQKGLGKHLFVTGTWAAAVWPGIALTLRRKATDFVRPRTHKASSAGLNAEPKPESIHCGWARSASARAVLKGKQAKLHEQIMSSGTAADWGRPSVGSKSVHKSWLLSWTVTVPCRCARQRACCLPRPSETELPVGVAFLTQPTERTPNSACPGKPHVPGRPVTGEASMRSAQIQLRPLCLGLVGQA